MTRALVSALLALATVLATARAHAADPEVAVEAAPILGSNSIEPGWNEIAIRVQNLGAKPARGEVSVGSQGYIDPNSFRATAPFNVAPGSEVIVRVPAFATPYADLGVRVLDDGGRELLSQRFSPTNQNSVLLVDVSEVSHLRAAINEASVGPGYTPPSTGRGSSGGAPVLNVSSPRFAPATGDPILPDRPAFYASAAAVLVRSDLLSRMAGPELQALAGYVLSGGTLAVVVARPEDLHHPTLTALVGGDATPGSPYAATLKRLSGPGAGGGTPKVIKNVPNPGDDLGKKLVGYSGGNLRGSIYGSSAYYGLGEVHLLAFDPTQKPAVDDPWAQARVVDLARRGYDRKSSIVYRPGGETVGDLSDTRKQLDPNEGSRWGIAAAALLLCLYAVVAGPVNFTAASRRGKPLRALRWLPIIAAGAFLLVVGIGVAARGIRGRARHLSLVEAGAGMREATIRRYRGFFTRGQKDLTVRASDASALVHQAVPADSNQSLDRMIVDRDGARLVDVVALPWQTIVVREDGLAEVGEGISIVKEATGGATVVNRSGRDLRAAILVLPGGDAFYFPRIAESERVTSTSGTAIGATVAGRTWLSRIGSGALMGSLTVHPLAGSELASIVGKDGPKLAEAWSALEDAAGNGVDWFPDGVPVLLGQLDGGEGRKRDSGLELESDRLLVRIVGWGGAP